MFKDLYQEGRYTDVTLVSDDQTQFKAHKIVLSACSPVFKKIIDSNPSQHPLIYLRGVQSYEVESILQFMYLGEGRFYHERMGEFIKVAKDLEMKEISDGVDMQNKEEKTFDVDDEEIIGDNDVEQSVKEENQIKVEETKIRLTRSQISSDAKTFQCPGCQGVFRDRSNLVKHYRSEHEGIRYPCNHCDYQAKRLSHLKDHISAKHSEDIIKCDFCDFETKWKQQYRKHMKDYHLALTR